MPNLTFSPLGLLSVASSRTRLRKTFNVSAHIPYMYVFGDLSYIVASQGAHHFPRTIELDFDALVKVLLLCQQISRLS